MEIPISGSFLKHTPSTPTIVRKKTFINRKQHDQPTVSDKAVG